MVTGSWEQDRFRDYRDARFDEAHAETHELLKRQHEASKVHPEDRIAEIDPERASAWIGSLRDQFMDALGEPGLRVCPHLTGATAMEQPLFFRQWRPGLRCLKLCQPPHGFQAPAGWPCFRCDQPAADPLYIQTFQLGFIACYFGLCPDCLATTLAEMKESEVAQ